MYLISRTALAPIQRTLRWLGCINSYSPNDSFKQYGAFFLKQTCVFDWTIGRWSKIQWFFFPIWILVGRFSFPCTSLIRLRGSKRWRTCGLEVVMSEVFYRALHVAAQCLMITAEHVYRWIYQCFQCQKWPDLISIPVFGTHRAPLFLLRKCPTRSWIDPRITCC